MIVTCLIVNSLILGHKWIEPNSPNTFNNHKINKISTTIFNNALIEAAIGI